MYYYSGQFEANSSNKFKIFKFSFRYLLPFKFSLKFILCIFIINNVAVK